MTERGGGEYAERLQAIQEVQHAIKGAVQIFAHGWRKHEHGLLEVVVARDSDSFLDSITGLIGFVAGMRPEYTGDEWGAFLRRVNQALQDRPVYERRGMVQGALLGLGGGGVAPIDAATGGGLEVRRSQVGAQLIFDPRVDLFSGRWVPEVIAGNEFHTREGAPTSARVDLGRP